MRPTATGVTITLALLFVAIQLVPYGRTHTNPPVRSEPQWDSPRTRELAVRACYDCHSNETEWPWYSNVAPVSWLIQNDVDEGRAKLNFSEWDRPQEEAGEAAESVQKGEMPPWYYLLPRPQARLSSQETAFLIQGLEATLGRESEERAGDSRAPGRRDGAGSGLQPRPGGTRSGR